MPNQFQSDRALEHAAETLHRALRENGMTDEGDFIRELEKMVNEE